MGSRNLSWVSQIRKGVVEIAVMGALSHREMYASEIIEALSGRSELAITPGTIYPLLSRLRKGGVIESVWRESSQGPPRKYYTLTDAGRSDLKEMAEVWNRVSDGVDGILKGGK